MNQSEFTYTVKRCCSPSYYHEKVTPAILFLALQEFAAAADRLDRIKKTLFYGKDEPVFLTKLNATVEFDHETLSPDVAHAVIGIATEAGELVERLMKAGSYPEKADEHRLNFFEESGDVEWYQMLLYSALGFDQAQVRAANHAKLLKRFPEKFTEANADQRDLPLEQATLADNLG